MAKTIFFPAADQALALAVEYAISTGVEGDVAEFGCFRGHSAGILAAAMAVMGREYGYSDQAHAIPPRHLWVFDSFQGFPATTNPVDLASPHIKAGVWYAGQPAGGHPEEVHAICASHLGPDRVHVVAGWFKDTLPKLPQSLRLAVVHIDCDYYESTKQVLDHLFTHAALADGATLLFDDWYANRGSPDYGEQRAWGEAVAKFHVRYTDWGPYGVAGRRFIVHVQERWP